MDVCAILLQTSAARNMADGSERIGIEQLEHSLNLELTANEHELQALGKALDDRLHDFGGGNKPRNVTPSVQVFRYGVQGRVTESEPSHSKRKLKSRKITTSVINTDEGKFLCSAAV